MSFDYRIGLASDSLTDLIDDPFSTIENEIVGYSLAGTPINVAMDTITWKWKNMSQTAWNQIRTFWSDNIEAANPPPYVYIKSLREDQDTFMYGTFRCKMGRPKSEVTVSLAEVRDGEVIFYQCELIA